jgi:hypothetical protein
MKHAGVAQQQSTGRPGKLVPRANKSARQQIGSQVTSAAPRSYLSGVMAISGDVHSNRVLHLHFRRPVTDRDRADLLEAINLKIAKDLAR